MKLTPPEMRRIRKRSGYSQLDLAKHLGVSTLSVSHWETGVVKPREMNLKRYLRFIRHQVIKEHAELESRTADMWRLYLAISSEVTP